MGHIDEYTRRVYAEILFGFIRRDYKRVAEVHFEAGYVPADRDVDEFARALRAVGEPIFGMDATQDLDGQSADLPVRSDRTVRHGNPDRADPAATHHGGGRRRRAVAEPAYQHLAGRAARWSRTTSAKASARAPAVRDLGKTLAVLARYGPRLPRIVEAALIRQSSPPAPPKTRDAWRVALWVAFGTLIGTVLSLLAHLLI